MITTIAKRFTFDAAHFLPTVPEGHKCRRMHGHTYEVEFRFRAPTDANGFCGAIDYADIARGWEEIHARIDHRLLNDIPGLEVPSTEHLVAWMICSWRAISPQTRLALHSVKVAESSTTWCEGTVADYLTSGGA